MPRFRVKEQMYDKLFDLSKMGGPFAELQEAVWAKTPTVCINLPKCVKAIIAARLDKCVLYVAQNKFEADEIYKGVTALGEKAVFFDCKPEILLTANSFSKSIYFSRLTALKEIICGEASIAVTYVECLMQLCPPKDAFCDGIFKLEKNQSYSFERLSERLVEIGYERVEMVTSGGQFAVRGDIFDVALPNGAFYRLDFFGDFVERIKSIDVESGKSEGDFPEITIYPASEVLYGEDEREALLKKIAASLPNTNSMEEDERRDELRDRAVLAAENVSRDAANAYLLPLIGGKKCLLDYIAADTLVVFDDYYKIEQFAASTFKEHVSRYQSLLLRAEVLTSQINQLVEFSSVIERVKRDFSRLALNSIASRDESFEREREIQFKISAISSYQIGYEEIAKDINNWLKNGYTVVVFGKNEEIARALSHDVSLAGGLCVYEEDDSADLSGAVVLPYYFERGAILHDAKLALVGSLDVLKKAREQVSQRKRKVDVFLAPEVGDYVVHEIHGIGKLVAVSTVKTGTIVKDYAIVEYKGGDKLYIPADQMDMLVKFSGSERAPSLSKIGGKDFEKVKERVKKSIKQMAFSLKELYKKRERDKGFAFEADSELQREFEDAFAYEETPDQLRSIEEIKADMQSPNIMDRLLCGDVGYGKTEVAFRAAFKAVENGKQVCFLAPTTILSSQHYNTAVERFKSFGVRLGLLNRFKTDREQGEIIKQLKTGKIDMVFGTHRLLSKDVDFSDLGLLILDEEQRFGVEDKEKIKNLKNDVDVLSMSATPIPRTLHMSLSGIRDISVIETPPTKRLPVQVYVTEQTDGLITDAILRELGRGGQVFVLYNKVESIYSFANHLQELIPNARLIVTHGQMAPKALEANIEKFVLGEADVLVTTTIIENGIDIARANTMVVIDSDRLGLSQLYQLKGRVGRSDKLAYIYFTYQEDKTLSDTAYKRLSAIMEYTDFGSGFKIAMRDLEIRGSGNVLGREQHGHMEAVGYDMYCKLLRETIGGEDGEPVVSAVEMDVDASAFISEEYVPSSHARMSLYREISELATAEEVTALCDKLKDIYGKVPTEVKNLCLISLYKNMAAKIGATKIVIKQGGAKVYLSLNSLKNQKLLDYVDENGNIARLSADKDIAVSIAGRDFEKNFKSVYNFLRKVG